MSGFLSTLANTASSIFGSPPPAAAPAQAAQNTQTAQPQVETPPPAPLDPFKELWQNPTTPNGPDTTRPGAIFQGADPGKMLEAARKVDFSNSVTEDMMAKIAAGGPEATKTLLQAMNSMAQAAYAQGAYASTQMIERGLGRYDEGLNSRLPSQIKRHNVSEAVRESNPALSHPAVQPVVMLLESQFTTKFPTASPAQIREHVENYLTSMGRLITDKGAKISGGTQGTKDDDWGDFFGSESSVSRH